jgi:hypothetical protein
MFFSCFRVRGCLDAASIARPRSASTGALQRFRSKNIRPSRDTHNVRYLSCARIPLAHGSRLCFTGKTLSALTGDAKERAWGLLAIRHLRVRVQCLRFLRHASSRILPALPLPNPTTRYDRIPLAFAHILFFFLSNRLNLVYFHALCCCSFSLCADRVAIVFRRCENGRVLPLYMCTYISPLPFIYPLCLCLRRQ